MKLADVPWQVWGGVPDIRAWLYYDFGSRRVFKAAEDGVYMGTIRCKAGDLFLDTILPRTKEPVPIDPLDLQALLFELHELPAE